MKLLEILKDYNPKQQGTGEIKMACCYRSNHSAGKGSDSAFLNPHKNVYHCFSCGASSTAISVLTNKIGVPLSQAVELVNIDYLGEDKVRPTSDTYVTDSPIYVEAPEYFLERGFSRKVLEHFKVGYTVDERGRKVIAIPLYSGDVLKGIKYRLRRDFWYSTGFDRSNYLYNLHSKAHTIVVESESDLWRAYQNGTTGVVATLGSAVSHNQIEILKRYEKVYLAFDNDDAGSLATEVVYNALKSYTEVAIVPYPTKDPGDCSKDDWAYGISHAADYATYNMEMSLRLGDAYEALLNRVKKIRK